MPRAYNRHSGTCRFPGCFSRKLQRWGFCNKHRKWIERGFYDLDLNQLKPLTVRMGEKNPCKVEGCQELTDSKGFCTKHYKQFYSGLLHFNGTTKRTKKRVVDKYAADFACLVCGKRTGRIIKGFCKFHYGQHRAGLLDFDGVQIRAPKRVTAYAAYQNCIAPNCGGKRRSRNFCSNHYEHFRKGRIDAKGLRINPRLRVDIPCAIKSCEKRAFWYGFCRGHYKEAVDLQKFTPEDKHELCRAENCEQAAVTRGFCQKHYSRGRLKWRHSESSGVPLDKLAGYLSTKMNHPVALITFSIRGRVGWPKKFMPLVRRVRTIALDGESTRYLTIGQAPEVFALEVSGTTEDEARSKLMAEIVNKLEDLPKLKTFGVVTKFIGHRYLKSKQLHRYRAALGFISTDVEMRRASVFMRRKKVRVTVPAKEESSLGVILEPKGDEHARQMGRTTEG